MPDEAQTKRPPFALAPVAAVAGCTAALHLAVAGRYGWQRDELYYAVAGRRLQGGYVEFPPVIALLAAFARAVFGWSLVGFRVFPLLAGIGSLVVAALVARDLGGSSRAQAIAAIAVGFSPLLIATNGLFQPVSFDQLTTMIVLWLALRLALGEGGWPLLGLAAGVGLETKYTLAVVLALLVATFLVWRRDLLRSRGFPAAVALAALLVVPNLVWQARHGWASVHWFLNPPASATDESRPEYVVNLLLLTHLVAVPVAVAGVVSLVRDRRLRPLRWTVVGTAVAYLVLGGKSYYAMPAVLFALAAGAVPFDRWASRRRLWALGIPFVAFLVLLLPLGLPVLPLRTADRLGVIKSRSDYQDEVGWHRLARDVGRLAPGSSVVVTLNYGEAGALELFGRRLPPVASPDVTFRYWRPHVSGRRALLVGFARGDVPFCRDYRVVGRIRMPVENEERGRPIARCTLDESLAEVWPRLVSESD
ncbi:MAG TPA: glycosyltransferase family 39 protein [Gaiellaceae bacterium]